MEILPASRLGRSVAVLSIVLALAVLLVAIGRDGGSAPPQAEKAERAPDSSAQSAPVLRLRSTDEPRPGARGRIAKLPATAPPRSGVVIFPDGEQMPVDIRTRPAISHDYSTPLAIQYPSLRRVAAFGDGGSAYALFLGLKTCSGALKNEADVTRAVERLYSAHELMLPGMREPWPIDPELIADTETGSIRGPFEFCKGVTAEQEQETEKWLAAAAAAGILPARIQYPTLLGNSDQALKEWEKTWQLGEVNALSWIRKLYEEGSSQRAPDPALAYAYLYADAKLYEALTSGDVSPATTRDLLHYRQLLDEKGKALPPYQVEAAIARAKIILRENKNCCFWP